MLRNFPPFISRDRGSISPSWGGCVSCPLWSYPFWYPIRKLVLSEVLGSFSSFQVFPAALHDLRAGEKLGSFGSEAGAHRAAVVSSS